MARREIIRGSAAGVQLIEVVHQMSQRVFSRYAVTTLRGRSRRDFVSMRTARIAFDEEVAASRRQIDAKSRSPVQPGADQLRTFLTAEAGGPDGQS